MEMRRLINDRLLRSVPCGTINSYLTLVIKFVNHTALAGLQPVSVYLALLPQDGCYSQQHCFQHQQAECYLFNVHGYGVFVRSARSAHRVHGIRCTGLQGSLSTIRYSQIIQFDFPLHFFAPGPCFPASVTFFFRVYAEDCHGNYS